MSLEFMNWKDQEKHVENEWKCNVIVLHWAQTNQLIFAKLEGYVQFNLITWMLASIQLVWNLINIFIKINSSSIKPTGKADFIYVLTASIGINETFRYVH